MKTRKIGAILLIMVMVLTMMPLSAMAATATAIKFEKTSDMKAEQGKAYRREAITTPEGATVTYSSSNTKVVTVDETGRVTAVAEGKAVITAKSGKVTASYNVVVSKATGTSTASNTTPKNVSANGYKTLKEAAAAHPNVTWFGWHRGGGNMYPFSNSTVKKAIETGFNSKQELINEFYYGVAPYESEMINKDGKWFPNGFGWLQFYQYYPTVESIVKASPDAYLHRYLDFMDTWVAYGKGRTVINDIGIDSKSTNLSLDTNIFDGSYNRRGPFSTKAEAEKAGEEDVAQRKSQGENFSTYWLEQNEHSKKWFYYTTNIDSNRWR